MDENHKMNVATYYMQPRRTTRFEHVGNHGTWNQCTYMQALNRRLPRHMNDMGPHSANSSLKLEFLSLIKYSVSVNDTYRQTAGLGPSIGMFSLAYIVCHNSQ